MDIITLDWETYYDAEYSLSRMSTEEYVCDPRFEIIMAGIKVNGRKAAWYSCKDLAQYAMVLEKYRVRGNALLCHNTLFDALILAIHFGIIPPMLLDTMGMAQAIMKPYHRSVSLASCLKNTDLGVQKGTYVANMKGRRLASLSSSELAKYGQYCMDDCEGEYALFQHLVTQLPREELEVIDMTLRMYLQPQFLLDRETLQHVHTDTVNAKKDLIAKLPPDILPSQLSSNPQLAQLLEKLGVEVPMKISPTTDKPTYAFAKNDMGWKELEDEYMDDPLIAPILAARLGVKSTLAETRSKRLIDIADAYEWFRIPLRYYAAHTGRYGGMEKLNAQNFTRVNPKLGHRRQLRYGLKAPPGKSVLAPDLSQIEARLNAWLSGCNTLLEIFRRGGDPYCEFASKAFRRPVTKADETERFIGKTCILGLGYGMGAKKLRATLRKDGVKVSEQQADNFVQTYRSEYSEIRSMWNFCGQTMEIMCNGGYRQLGPCRAEHRKIILPNGMPIVYHNLRWIETKKYRGYVYDFAGQGRTLWGGKMVENICQSLARIIIMGNMRQVRKQLGLQPALQAHDELVYVVDTTNVEYYRDEILKIMTIPPGFAPDLPMGAEAEFGPTYGDAK